MTTNRRGASLAARPAGLRPLDRPASAGDAQVSAVDNPASSADEAELIDAVRSGHSEAYGILYSRHIAAVSAVARRLSRSAFEADDVSSEVFCNALRAIQNGHGPTDDLRPYLLRSVRHTITKLRTRTDTARTIPMTSDRIDRADPSVHFQAPGPGVDAFHQVSERFQRTLWSVEVEGTPTSVLADHERISAPAGASLAYRARCALRRAYVAASMDTPASTGCRPFRALVPSFLDGGLGHAASLRLSAHTDDCRGCADAVTNAERVHGTLGNKSWFSLAIACVRSVVGVGVQSLGATVGAVPAAAGVAAITSAAIVSFAAVAVLSDGDDRPTAVATTNVTTPISGLDTSDSSPTSAGDTALATSRNRSAEATTATQSTPTTIAAALGVGPPKTPTEDSVAPIDNIEFERDAARSPRPTVVRDGTVVAPTDPGDVIAQSTEAISNVVDGAADSVGQVTGSVVDMVAEVTSDVPIVDTVLTQAVLPIVDDTVIPLVGTIPPVVDVIVAETAIDVSDVLEGLDGNGVISDVVPLGGGGLCSIGLLGPVCPEG